VDVAAWLRSLGLEHYAEAFRANDINADVLPELTAEDLIGLGVTSIGHRRKLLAAIADLHGGPSPATVLPSDDRSVPAADAGAVSPLPEGERRQVTVLFADLAGYTKLGSELDAEDLHALLEGFFGLVDRTIDDYGGRVDKHIGDCVMAVFGAPVAHGNDPERAVRAALAIRDAMPALTKRLGRPVGVHIGVASGQVVASGTGSASHREYTVTGDSVNLASRLTDTARPGQILVSEAVCRALAGRLECSEAGALAVKGFAEPVRAWRLLALRKAALDRRPFVGRRGELHQFAATLAACRETGSGQAIYVRGEAGIGKTRLVEEFQRLAAEQGFACHTGQVLDFGAGTGRDAVRSLVRGLLDLAPSGGGEAARAAAALDGGLVEPDRAVYLNDLLDLPQPKELWALYDAMDNASRNRGKRETVAQLVQRASRRRPLLLVIEDLQWADGLTLAHLAKLAEVVADCPALLVMTSRIEGDPLGQAWRSRTSGAPLVTIDLGLLRRDEALALVRLFADGATERLAERYVERAAGNPLFLEQLLRHAAQESVEAAVPGSVQSLVQARMDQLGPEDKRALQAASVFGQQFSLAGLRHLIGNARYGCAALVAHYLVRPQREDFLFAHALIRDAVYDSLLKSRRRELHRAAADWYGGCDPVLRAEHLERAEEPEAPRAYGDAAKAEAAVLRYERALGMAERGLALARTTEERLDLTMLRAEFLREVGRVRDSIAVFREALDLATDEMIRCRAWIGIAAGVRLLGGSTEGMEALAEAEPLVRRHHADRELARICYYRGCLLFAAGDVVGCLEQHGQARDAAVRAGDPEWEAWALSGLGDAHYGQGRMRLAIENFRRCQALCRQHGFGRAEVGSIHMIGVTRRYLNEFREALDNLRAAASTAARVGNRRTEMVALTLLGELLVDHGDLDGAYTAFDKAMAVADAFGNRRYRAYILYELGRAVWHDDRRRDEAEPVLAEALRLSRETGVAFIGPRVLAAKALTAYGERERSEALDEGEAIARSGCLAHNVLWFYRDAIEASLNAGDWDAAKRYAAALDDYTRPEPLPWADFFIARGCTLAAHGRGRRDGMTVQELCRLRDEAKRPGLRMALPALDRALQG
jgi:class 3 adenylate cyclase/tetratricopeptide (TPR) repeat protein